MLRSNESLFKNEDSLDPEWLPKNLPYREMQHHHIANMIKPLIQGRTGRNCLISGAPGIGKTAAVRLVLKELEESTNVDMPDVSVLYVNCWQKNTTYKIFVELCEQLGYRFTQNKNTEDLFKIIQNIVNKKAVVFAFDEVDKVDDVDFLYQIFTDVLKKTIVMITNHPEWYAQVDTRIRSRLLPETISFSPYSNEEVEGILKERIGFAFHDNTIEDEALKSIVDKTVQAADLRTGLYLLREAALAAEDSGSKRVLAEHAQKAVGKLTDMSIKPKEDLSVDARFILELIKQQSEGKIGDLFRLYQETGGDMNYKTFQRRVDKLAQGGYITAKKVIGGKDGTTTIVSELNKSLTEF